MLVAFFIIIYLLMVRKIGGSDIYCELKETNRRMCKVTKNKTKNSDDCEYRKDTKNPLMKL